MSWAKTLFGRIKSRGTPTEVSGGVNFKGGLVAVNNPATGDLDIDVGEDAALLMPIGANTALGSIAGGMPVETDPDAFLFQKGAVSRLGAAPYATAALLRAVTPEAGRVAETVDAVTAGDGGGGQWEAFAGSPGTWTHNGIDTLVPASGTGSDGSRAWLRKNYEFLTPEMAGCAGDGSTDDQVNFLAVCARAVASSKPVRVTKLHALSTALILTSAHNGLTLEGSDPANVGFVSTGTSKDVVHISGATGITVRGLRIEGNETTVGSTGFAGADGHGISFTQSYDISIDHCAFYNIAAPGTFDEGDGATFGAIAGHRSSKIRISACYIDSSCVGRYVDGHTGNDFFLSYGVHDTVVTQCISESAMNQGGYYSAVSYVATDSDPDTDEDVESDMIRHVFSDNIMRRSDEGCRSGVLAGYSSRCVMTITGNIFEGFIWCGVYNNTATNEEELTGANVISSNIVRYCGGANDTLSAGILSGGNRGGVISSNHVFWAGYKRDGTERGEPSHSIKVQRSRGLTVIGNSCYRATGHGLHVAPGEGSNGIGRADLAITGNTFTGGKLSGTYFLGGWDDAESMTNIRYTGNTIHAMDDGAHGIWVNHTGEASLSTKSIDIASCSLRSSAAAPGTGIYYRSAHDSHATISDCRIAAFDYGFHHYGALTSRVTPKNLWVHHLRVENCARAISGYSATVPFYVFDCVFSGSTVADLANGAVMAQIIGRSPVTLEVSLVNEFATATPTVGEHHVGDRWTNTAPAVGGKRGGVCVTAGTPGTWVDEYLPYTGSTTVDVTSIADQASFASSGVTITGVALGDFVDVSCSVDLQGLVLRGHVSAANTVNFTLSNQTGAPVDLVSATYKFRVWRA